jgi:hypothetical protein
MAALMHVTWQSVVTALLPSKVAGGATGVISNWKSETLILCGWEKKRKREDERQYKM